MGRTAASRGRFYRFDEARVDDQRPNPKKGILVSAQDHIAVYVVSPQVIEHIAAYLSQYGQILGAIYDNLNGDVTSILC